MLKLNDLALNIVVRHFPQMDVTYFYHMLHENPKLARKSFVELVKKALQEFHKDYGIHLRTDLRGQRTYTFCNNFIAYLDGIIPRDQIQLIPQTISGLNSTWGVSLTPSTSYRYERPTLYTTGSLSTVMAFYHYPFIVEELENGLYSQRSGIYGIQREEHFLVYLDYIVLQKIQTNTTMVTVGDAPYGLSLEGIISDLKEEKELIGSFSTQLYNLWYPPHVSYTFWDSSFDEG